MDPFAPVPEVRKANRRDIVIDEFGEEWMMIDGVETKLPSIKKAIAQMKLCDETRVKIRADLDAAGLRDNVVETEITLEDGTTTTVSMHKPGDVVMQFDATRPPSARSTVNVPPPPPLPTPTDWRSRVKGFVSWLKKAL